MATSGGHWLPTIPVHQSRLNVNRGRRGLFASKKSDPHTSWRHSRWQARSKCVQPASRRLYHFPRGVGCCRKTSLAGHEDPNEVKVHLRLAESLPQRLCRAVLDFRIQSRNLKLFDYGGSVGNLYYSYSPYLRDIESVEWTVFEIPNVVESGREIAAERKADRIAIRGRRRFVPLRANLAGFGGVSLLGAGYPCVREALRRGPATHHHQSQSGARSASFLHYRTRHAIMRLSLQSLEFR